MTNREAIERGMAAIEGRGLIDVKRKASPKSFTATRQGAREEADTQSAEAAKDAEAWNALKHLASVL